jgi:MFS family permease
MSFLEGLGIGGFRLLFNFYVLSLGYNEAFVGTLQTMQSLAAIVAAIPAAYVADRLPSRPLLVAVPLALGLAIIGLVALPLPAFLVVFRMLLGTAIASREVVVATYLMQNTSDDERQWVFSFNFCLMMAATFFGYTIGGALPTWIGSLVGEAATSTVAYQGAIGLLGFAASLGGVPAFLLRESGADARGAPDLPWRLLRKHGRSVIRFLLPNVIIGLGAGMMMPFMNIYFRKVYGRSDAFIGVLFAAGSIFMALAQFAGPVLAEAKGKIRAVIFAQALSIPFLVLLGLGAFLVPAGIVPVGVALGVAIVAFNARIALMNMGNPIYQTFVLEHVDSEVRAMSMSLLSISFQFGWFVMPQVSGSLQVLFGDFGFVPVFAGVILFYAAAILLERRFFLR